ncbi:hypothetical protein [Desulfoprunum sp.]
MVNPRKMRSVGSSPAAPILVFDCPPLRAGVTAAGGQWGQGGGRGIPPGLVISWSLAVNVVPLEQSAVEPGRGISLCGAVILVAQCR